LEIILGDEILAVNGLPLQGLSHSEAISAFKNIRQGKVLLHVIRRDGNIAKRFIILEKNYFPKFKTLQTFQGHNSTKMQQGIM